MPEFVNRTLSLREAVNMNGFAVTTGGPGSLEALFRAAHPNGSALADRTIEIGDLIVQARHFRNDQNFHLLHLVGYVPDDKMQVVPVGDEAEVDLELADPPEDTEFLDGEMMLLVRGNDVLICRSGLSERAVLNYIEQIGIQAGIPADTCRCVFGKRIDIDKLALIAREGVHRLKMNAVSHAVSVDEVQRGTVRKKLVGSVLDEIRDILGIDEEIPEEAENLKVEVSLSFDKRGNVQVVKDQLEEMARSVLGEDDEGFSIETMNGRKVRSDDILLTKAVSMETFGKSVRHNEAWRHLIDFDTEIRAANDE